MKTRGLLHTLILALSFNPLAVKAQQDAPLPEPPIKKRAHRYAAIVIDAKTGETLYARDPDQKLHPASTTKVMTAYLVFEALKNGVIAMDEKLPVSQYAATRERTNLGMTASTKSVTTVTKNGKKLRKTSWTAKQVVYSITVKDALLGMITHSANDASVVLAERIGGTQASFAYMMNRKAEELGMANTVFANPNGLPHPKQRTTVEDMAKLCQALIRDFPEEYGLFATTKFAYNGQSYKNYNKLLETYPGADGIKTGTIRASGANLTASAVRDGTRVIGIVFGASSAAQRNSDMKYLLDYGFSKLKDPKAGFTEPPEVRPGQNPNDVDEEEASFGVPDPITVQEEEEVPEDPALPPPAKIEDYALRVREPTPPAGKGLRQP